MDRIHDISDRLFKKEKNIDLGWVEYYKKAGGIKLLRLYLQNGALFTAVIQFLLLGRSKKALEILRLSVGFKVHQKLEREYGKFVNRNLSEDTPIESRNPKFLWIYWHQGIENAPELVRCCYRSVVKNLSNWDIRVITAENINEYVQFPSHIMKKVDNGQITLTHLSDLLRLELLIRYGGLWMDSTVLCTDGNIPDVILKSDLFCYQCLKPGADGHSSLMSSWLIYSKANNHLLKETLKLCYKYWETHSYMVDYFLLHQFFSIVCDRVPDEARKIPQYCNSTPHIMLLNILEKFDQVVWNDICNQTSFHKLSYKLPLQGSEIGGTYYEYILKFL